MVALLTKRRDGLIASLPSTCAEQGPPARESVVKLRFPIPKRIILKDPI